MRLSHKEAHARQLDIVEAYINGFSTNDLAKQYRMSVSGIGTALRKFRIQVSVLFPGSPVVFHSQELRLFKNDFLKILGALRANQ